MAAVCLNTRWITAVVLSACIASASSAATLEVEPGSSIYYSDEGTFELKWKRPLFGGRGPAMELTLPPACRALVPPVSSNLGDALLERRLIDCGAAGLGGQQIHFPELDQTLSDVLVRIELADGGTFDGRARLKNPSRATLPIELPSTNPRKGSSHEN
jgi:hypothetical protein